jgi:hypothetical protein
MTIKEAEDFYKTDTMQYDFNCRENFKPWFKKAFNNGESSYLDIEGLNRLVNKIISWYEFKFPNIELDRPGCVDTRFENTPDISSYMDNEQLRYRLMHGERETMDCNYRTGSGYLGHDGKWYAGIKLSKNGVDIWDISISMDGKLASSTREKYHIPVETIEQFYDVLKFSNEFDLKHTKDCIELHKNDTILRNYIIDAVRNGLLYSSNTIPEYGNIRVEHFTKDMLNLYPDIDLNARCANELIVPEIIEVKVKQKGFIKRLIGRDRNEESRNIGKY